MSIFKVGLFVKSTLLLSSCIASAAMAQQQVTVRNLNDITLTACGSLACLQDQAEAFPVGGVGYEPLATAVGLSATVRAAQGTAVGFGAETSGVNSVAVGAGSRDNGLSNVFSVGSIGGERRVINVSPGTVAAGSTDAVNGGQLFAAQQSADQALAAANSGSSTAAQALSTANAANATAAQALTAAKAASVTFGDLSRSANAGVATAIASANIPQAYGPGRTAIGGAIGTWRGQTSFAVGATHNFERYSVRGSFNVDSHGSTGGGAGFGVQF